MSKAKKKSCASDSAFSLFEVLVTAGLIAFTLSLSINATVDVLHRQHQAKVMADSALALEDFLNGIRSASSYDERLRDTLAQGMFAQSFVLGNQENGTKLVCDSALDSANSPTIVFTCKNMDGRSVRRVFVPSMVGPAPGSILTPAPSDIIRLHVST